MPQLKNTNVFIPTDVEPYNYLSIEDYVSSIVQYLEVYTQKRNQNVSFYLPAIK